MLRKLDSIECRDALLTADGKQAAWPAADFIVGNPPFLGGKMLRGGLGDAYVETLFAAYDGLVPAEADLVCYWFAKAWRCVDAISDRVRRVSGSAATVAAAGPTRSEIASTGPRVGLVATNSIRGGANRKVLEPIAASHAIFEAWSDEAWTVDGGRRGGARVARLLHQKLPSVRPKPSS